MKKHFSHLLMVDNNEVITPQTHNEFLYHLELALLLALKERGRLNHEQYRTAESKLKQSYVYLQTNMIKQTPLKHNNGISENI